MRYFKGIMQFYCHVFIVLFFIETTLAANITSSDSDGKHDSGADTKNKRQVNQFLRTPETSGATETGVESEPQAFPLQLSHGIYSQQRASLYTRRPTTVSKPQVVEDTEEQEPQPQQQQHQSIVPSYYNYVRENEEDERLDTVNIDSRHLPVEARNQGQAYQSTPRYQYSYPTSVAPRQSTSSQPLYTEDEYFDLIQNTDLAKHQPVASSRIPYGQYITTAATTALDNEYSTKSPFSTNEFKKYTSRTQSTPFSHYQAQNSRQQIVRQPVQVEPALNYAAAGSTQEYTSTYDKDTIRVSLKKHQDIRPKYDPAHGQYHQEVTPKPAKKLVSFKPSLQYTSTPSQQLSSQSQYSGVQTQPLHYQSVQHIAQTEVAKAGQQQQAQSQYSIVVPQQGQGQAQAYAHQNYPAEASQSVPSFYQQSERLVSDSAYGPFNQGPANLQAAPLQNDNRPNGQPDFRIQYVQHVSPTPTPTPTPTPRARIVQENGLGQPLKYEVFDQNGNVNTPKEAPRIKLIPAPQHIHRPQFADQQQFYKKVKLQPAAHVHYLPVRPQYPTPQPTPAQSQSDGDILIPIQPSRSTLFVAPNNGLAPSPSPSSNGEKYAQPIPNGHQTHSEARKPPLPITSPKKPITQAEFQALVDAGYKVQAIPVPVPVPVSADKFKQLQFQQRQQHHIAQPHNPAAHPIQHNRQASAHYIRYHPKPESDDGILTSYLKPLIDYIGGPSQ